MCEKTFQSNLYATKLVQMNIHTKERSVVIPFHLLIP